MLWVCAASAQTPASAQVVEAVGSRALGMGGAFVAVASDSSAAWWNPAGLAAGPVFDMALARSRVDREAGLPAWRQRTSSLALGTPVIGVSYYRFRITDIRPSDPTAGVDAGRQEEGAGVPVRSLSASQFGVTLVQTVIPGVHAGATLKYVRGTVSSSREEGRASPAALLDRGEALDASEAEKRFDVDLGVLATAGVIRVGMRLRNALEPTIGAARLERQARVGVAFDPESATGVPLTVAFDADLGTDTVASEPRRMVSLGAEQWLLNRRLGVRAGARMNTVGARERSATAGASVAVRGGLYLEGHVVRGGSDDERGWGVAARVSF